MRLLRIGEPGEERPERTFQLELGQPDHPYRGDGDVVRLEIDGLGRAEQCFTQEGR